MLLSMTTGTVPDDDHRSRQKRVGAVLRSETRIRLLTAAETEFQAHGYTGTTVTRLAVAAGVSVQTLYLAWGSKRGLLRGYLERALAGDAPSPAANSDGFAGMSARERLATLANLVADIAGRAALGWRLYRDAAAVDPEIAADWDELQLLRRGTFARILAGLPPEALRDGLNLDAAIDTAWTIASPESHDLLTRRLGYTLEEYRGWTERTLIAALLSPASG